MKITSLKILNFKALHDIEFSSGSSQSNLAFINGRNGNGKTSFQGALKWCFYGIVPESSIVSKYSVENGKPGEIIDVSVEVVFLDDESGDVFSVRRSQVFTISSPSEAAPASQPVVNIKRTPANPVEPTEVITDPDSWLELNFPSRLMNYFLFDGEIMFKFFDARVKGAIERAIREIARVDLFEKVAARFRAIELSANRSIARLSGSDAGRIQSKLEGEQQLANHLAGEIRTNQAAQNDLVDEISAIARKLAGREHLEDFVKEQNQLREKTLNLSAELKVRQSEFEARVISSGVRAMFSRTFEGFFAEVDLARSEDRLPPPFEPAPLEMLLDRQLCICGCEASPGSEAAQNIQGVIDKYTESSEIGKELQSTNDGILNARGALGPQKNAVDSLNSLIDGLEKQIAAGYNRIDEISRLIGDDNQDDIADLGRAQRVALERQRELIADRSSLDAQATKLAGAIEKLKSELDKSVKSGTETANLQKKAAVAGMLASAAENVHEQAIEIVRSKLEQSVTEKFSFVKQGFFRTKITENFDVLTLDQNGQEVVLSEGENMLKAYLFSISLREVIGLHFPLIVDTPYGRLDDLNRLELSKKLAEMIGGAANAAGVQTIFLMTDSEYTPYTRKSFGELQPVEAYLQIDPANYKTELGYGIAPDWLTIESGAWRDWAEGKIK